ncbi:hypothetical protein NDA18_002704 [Ustilago nuda]|nr:hypothetical protein NDA18_002704 [Ustilago nuda]
MRNPLSLHSGLGSLLFLSLIPVALSLPVGGGNGFQNDGFQNDGFQNHDFQNHNLYQWSPSNLQSVVTQQGPNVPQHGLPQQHLSSFGNAPQLTHVPQQQLPQHQLPQQHLSSFGNAPQPAQNAPKFSSTSRILSADEWDRLFLDSISRDLGRGESEIPPSLPSSHAGSYPSSSEARGFDRSRILPDDEWNRFVLDSSRQDLVRGKSAIPPSLPSSHAGSYPSSSEARGFDRSRILPDDEGGRSVLDSSRQDLVRGKSAIPPSLPPSHAGSYPSSSEARGFDRSRILPDDEWGRFVLDTSRQDLVRGKSAIPPSLPPSHAGSYPSSSEARGFDRSRILPDDEGGRSVLDSSRQDLVRGKSAIPPSLPPSHAGSYPSSSEARGFDRSRILPDDEGGRSVLDSSRQDLVRGKSAIPPSLPPSHAGSYPSSSEARGFDRSRILPDDEWGRFVLDTSRQDLVRGKSAIPPSLPPSHAGSYPSSSEARGFDRVSNEGASSRGKKRNNRYYASADEAVFNQINEEKFGGKLKKVNYLALEEVTQYGIKKKLRFPKNLYEIIKPGQHELQHDGVVINRVLMTVMEGHKKWEIKHPEAFAGIDPVHTTFFNFWGTPGNLKERTGTQIFHYGMGYLDPNQDKEWRDQLIAKLTDRTRTAARFH